MSNSIHVALTGHRPNKLGGYDLNTPQYHALQNDLEQYIRHLLSKYDHVWCHSGLALGADTLWSKAILAVRAQPEFAGRVFFFAEIPMMSQSSQWFKQSDLDFWQEQVDSADASRVYLKNQDTPLDKGTAAKALNDRNTGMVSHCDILLAVWDGTKGGTGNAVKDGIRMNKEIVRILPEKYFE